MKNTPKIVIAFGLLLIISPMLYRLQVADIPIFSSGFETGDFSDFDSTVTGTNDVANVIQLNGSYVGHFTTDGVELDEQAYVSKSFPASYYTISSMMDVQYGLANSWWKIIMEHSDASDLNAIAMVYVSSVTYRLWYRNGTIFEFIDGAYSSAIGTWYKVELITVVNKTSGEYQLSVNNSPIISVTGIDTTAYGNVGTAKFGMVTYPNYQANSSELWVDNVEITGSGLTPQYQLTVNSNPISGLSFAVDLQSGTTGTPLTLNAGTYTISIPSTIQDNGTTYDFDSWEDASTNPVRQITLTSNLTITATYIAQEPPPVETGMLSVHAFLGNLEIDAQGLIIEVSQSFSTTTSGVTFDLTPGTYTVEVTYSTETITQTATILNGQTTRLDFQFTSDVIVTPFDSLYLVQFGGVGLVAIGIYMIRRKKH